MRCRLPTPRHILSGSYNNNFHIYDKNAETDVVLQADKSAFKAKKVGAQKNKGANGKAGAAGKGANGTRTPIDTDNVDFNKKILHASWHPKEDTIAVSTGAPALLTHVRRRARDGEADGWMD